MILLFLFVKFSCGVPVNPTQLAAIKILFEGLRKSGSALRSLSTFNMFASVVLLFFVTGCVSLQCNSSLAAVELDCPLVHMTSSKVNVSCGASGDITMMFVFVFVCGGTELSDFHLQLRLLAALSHT